MKSHELEDEKLTVLQRQYRCRRIYIVDERNTSASVPGEPRFEIPVAFSVTKEERIPLKHLPLRLSAHTSIRRIQL